MGINKLIRSSIYVPIPRESIHPFPVYRPLFLQHSLGSTAILHRQESKSRPTNIPSPLYIQEKHNIWWNQHIISTKMCLVNNFIKDATRWFQGWVPTTMILGLDVGKKCTHNNHYYWWFWNSIWENNSHFYWLKHLIETRIYIRIFSLTITSLSLISSTLSRRKLHTFIRCTFTFHRWRQWLWWWWL